MKHLGLFAAGVLFGTAGLKILSSKEAKAFTRTPPQPFCAPRTASCRL